jgi:hypothetical protein
VVVPGDNDGAALEKGLHARVSVATSTAVLASAKVSGSNGSVPSVSGTPLEVSSPQAATATATAAPAVARKARRENAGDSGREGMLFVCLDTVGRASGKVVVSAHQCGTRRPAIDRGVRRNDGRRHTHADGMLQVQPNERHRERALGAVFGGAAGC